MINYIVLTALIFGLSPIQTAHSEPINPADFVNIGSLINRGTSFLASSITNSEEPKRAVVKASYVRTITAYSSSPEETDDTPFITASGNYVRIGTVAANWLPLGTAIRIPEIFGEQVFIVEDRMNRRHTDKVDIWFPNKGDALKFGKQIAKIEVL